MELPDRENQDVKTRAEYGEEYPIRILHLANEMIIIGYIIDSFSDVVMVLRPYIVDMDYDRENSNIMAYEIEPYLNQLALYNPNELDAVPFVMNNIISIAVPATHLSQNYQQIVAMKATAAVDAERILLTKRHYYNDKLVH